MDWDAVAFKVSEKANWSHANYPVFFVGVTPIAPYSIYSTESYIICGSACRILSVHEHSLNESPHIRTFSIKPRATFAMPYASRIPIPRKMLRTGPFVRWQILKRNSAVCEALI